MIHSVLRSSCNRERIGMNTRPHVAVGRSLFAAIMTLVLGVVLAVAALPVTTWADEGGQSSTAKPTTTTTRGGLAGGLPFMGNDYVWFGRNLRLGDCKVGNDVIAAGQIVSLDKCQAKGSVRAAAETIDIYDSTAGQNITLAARVITVKNATCNALAAAAQSIDVSGSYKELTANAATVYIDATVDGDVVVGAGEVTIGKNARIKGTLHVTSPSEPVLEQGAQVGKVDFAREKEELAQEETAPQSEEAAPKQEEAAPTSTEAEPKQEEAAPAQDEGVVEGLGGVLAGIGGVLTVIATIIGVVGTFVVAVLAEWLFSRHTAEAARLVRERTVPTIVSGVVGSIAAPVAVILMLILVVTIPVAIAVILAQLAMLAVAEGFMGASLSKIAFPKLGRYKCAMAGGAIVGVASAIPFLGVLVGIVAFVYLLGYVLQSIFLGLRKSHEDVAPID